MRACSHGGTARKSTLGRCCRSESGDSLKDGFHALQDDFGFGLDAPADIVIDGNLQSPEVLGAIDALIARFGESVLEINDTNDLGVLSVHLSGVLTSKATADACDAVAI